MKYININQKLKFKFCQVPRKILYTEPYKSILCPLSQLGYIFILDRLNLSIMNNKVDEQGKGKAYKIYVLDIYSEDEEMENLDLLQVTKRLLKNQYKAVAMYITTENLRQSINISELIKEISPTTKIIAYGTLSVLLANFFEKNKIDAIYTNGDQEKAI